MLASEYGWEKDYILTGVYPEELFRLIPQIKDRKRNDFLTQLAIAQNPFTEDPNELWKNFTDEKDYIEEEQLDREGMDRLKSLLGKGSAVMVK